MNRKISFQIQTIDGHSLAVDLFLPEIPGTEKLSTLVYCHGFKGFKDWGFVPHIEQFLVTENLALITFNYSHNGVIAKDFDDLDVCYGYKDLSNIMTSIKSKNVFYSPQDNKGIFTDGIDNFLIINQK